MAPSVYYYLTTDCMQSGSKHLDGVQMHKDVS
ncbi:hypothetical protein F441_16761 [Phytophthora nicotianae CJ01A1]|uniref:Uncharacterized protein n=4 Tax=Phytophthora nicotianae TaxID=4792 RepID=W2YJ97_PHYNI|nr:hypothetical protein L915_16446 [Phytophthora nicotianae]ETO65793.1 hypothetical protein F444_16940 [Phytophthora nicotianae P1976]ETP06903.1 hypothetical protein F441_16761 [Phytophthora nicotianae CJ01A1]ETP35001.1 hypothetical protein F442_16757 [Phytophthora nicotianae P10297]ETL30717.1 hypothetical protein L916_16345 [Phytophthora nicotianae]